MSQVEVIQEIAPSARVAAEAVIGPYCVVGPQVTIGPGTVLTQRVTVVGRTTLGSGNVVAEGCVLGEIPQDLKYGGAATLLIIAHRNRFGPRVTVHVGTELGGYLTRIGNDNLLQAGCHVAHDCYIDDRATLGRNVLLAGHVLVQTGAVIEDMVGAHHFTTIGRYARVGPRTPVRRDVPPFTDYFSPDHERIPPAVRGVHEAGIRAAGLSPRRRPNSAACWGSCMTTNRRSRPRSSSSRRWAWKAKRRSCASSFSAACTGCTGATASSFAARRRPRRCSTCRRNSRPLSGGL